MKVSELTGPLLDYWVGKALDFTFVDDQFIFGEPLDLHIHDAKIKWSPSTDWAHGGPIIEREGIGVWEGYDSASCGKVKVWEAADDSPVNAIEITGPMGKGPTPLIAAMRAFVRLKFGKEVEDL